MSTFPRDATRLAEVWIQHSNLAEGGFGRVMREDQFRDAMKALAPSSADMATSADVALRISEDEHFRKLVALGKHKSAAMQAALIAAQSPQVGAIKIPS